MRVLVIEDDPKISKFISKGLTEEGFFVENTSDGRKGLDIMMRDEDLDLAIIDLMLPGKDGISIINEVRRVGNNTPIIILSAKHKVEDKVVGLRSGGDDYLVKPFYFVELLERIRALIRRNHQTENVNTLNFCDIEINLLTHIVTRNGKIIDLNKKEYSLLLHFINNRNIVISKTSILENIWGFDFDPQTNIVDVLVCRLRNKIDNNFDKKLIHTVRGFGYVLKE